MADLANRLPRVQFVVLALIGLVLVGLSSSGSAADRLTKRGNDKSAGRPNFLFAIADDWGWPHAGAYGAPVVKTPTFDRIAEEGLLCHHAYISSPSCTPSRGAILTGQWHWRLGQAANLWSVFPDRYDTYPLMLERAGYSVGHSGKAWGPGRTATAGRQVAGKGYQDFQQFMDQREEGQPFCFWLGSSDPHRPYKRGSGAASGMEIDEVEVFPCFPDVEEIRSDVADYFFEVQRFDELVGNALKLLEQEGELENTVVLMTGDHGMPFPRCKANLYDSGTRVPLAIRWGAGIEQKGRSCEDFISLTDVAPTILELAELNLPDEMTGRSLVPLLKSDQQGRIDPHRDSILFGKERHVPGQEGEDLGGYPSRAIRTDDYLLILNLRPQRWPSGTPNWKQAAVPGVWLGDCDNGPTKTYLVENRERDEEHRQAYELAFGMRPKIELYDLKNDPGQLTNVSEDAKYTGVKEQLIKTLTDQLIATDDPRFTSEGEPFEGFKYLGSGPKHPDFVPENKKN